jgi:hypothetical protein
MTNSWLGVNVLVDASTGVDYIMRIRPVYPVMILSQNRYNGFPSLNQHGLLSTNRAHRRGARYLPMRQSGALRARYWRMLASCKWNENCIREPMRERPALYAVADALRHACIYNFALA